MEDQAAKRQSFLASLVGKPWHDFSNLFYLFKVLLWLLSYHVQLLPGFLHELSRKPHGCKGTGEGRQDYAF